MQIGIVIGSYHGIVTCMIRFLERRLTRNSNIPSHFGTTNGTSRTRLRGNMPLSYTIHFSHKLCPLPLNSFCYNMTSAFLSSPLANLSNRQLCPSKDRVARKQTHVNMKDENPVKVTAFPKPQKKNDPMCLLGPWTKHEHLAFLYGLRLYGPGRWKKIAELIPTR